MTAVTINGNAYSDDGTQTRDMRFGGHQSWLLPMLQDTMTEVDAANNAAISADASAIAAAASATVAANYSAALKGTSTTSLSLTVASQSLTTQAGKQFAAGQYVLLVDHVTPAQWMLGSVTSYNAGTGAMVVNVEDVAGTGTIALWDISLSGKRGAAGATGASGSASVPYSAKAANYMGAVTDKGKLIDGSGTFTLSFDAAATLGADWWCYFRNGGTGDITFDPSGAETIDGMTNFVSYPGEVRLIQCDGTTLRTVVFNPYYKVFTGSGTFTKPPGYRRHDGLLWAGGGGGAKGVGAPGGGGGSCAEFELPDTAIAATETVTIGATASGSTTATPTAGNNSTFGSLVRANGARAATTTNGGTAYVPTNYSFTQTLIGTGGDAGSYPTLYGGGSGNAGVETVYGGAGGAKEAGVASFTAFGGAGGTAGTTGAGGNGVTPAGGGGATNSGANGGTGARGELRIWGVV